MRVLLAVDVQPEFRDKDGHYERILTYIEKQRDKYDAVYGTICANNLTSPFVKNDIWTDCLDGVKPLDYTPDMVFVKYGYGFRDYEWLNPQNEYEIIGFNTDCCVLKIALDLFDRGYKIRVNTGLCYSSNGAENHERGVAVLKSTLKKLAQ